MTEKEANLESEKYGLWCQKYVSHKSDISRKNLKVKSIRAEYDNKLGWTPFVLLERGVAYVDAVQIDVFITDYEFI